jgi:hypothetical protein
VIGSSLVSSGCVIAHVPRGRKFGNLNAGELSVRRRRCST